MNEYASEHGLFQFVNRPLTAVDKKNVIHKLADYTFEEGDYEKYHSSLASSFEKVLLIEEQLGKDCECCPLSVLSFKSPLRGRFSILNWHISMIYF